MDNTPFLAQFGHIATAPKGIANLRALILQLAVQGKLVTFPQKEDLLASISAKRTSLFTLKQRKQINHYPLQSQNLPYPKNWQHECLGNLILSITGGGTPSKNNPGYWYGDIPWASVKDLKDYKYLERTIDSITQEGLKNSSSNLIPIGRYIVCTRMGLGKAAVNTVKLAINQDLKALELPEELNIDFFDIFYKSQEISGQGVTVSGIKQDDLLSMIVPLPPLEEQKRIVAKVDELMALCDQLEAQQDEQARNLLEANAAVTQALMAAVQSTTERNPSPTLISANLSPK